MKHCKYESKQYIASTNSLKVKKKKKEKILKKVERRREDRRKEGGHKSNVLQRVRKDPHVRSLPAVRLPEGRRNIRAQDT